jgi:hypothetical protein
MKKTIKSYLFPQVPNKGRSDNPVLLRITLLPDATKVDFGYSTFKSIFSNGGWIQISPETHLVSLTDKRKFKLLYVKGISMSPTKHYFESLRDWQYYSLYFEAIPVQDGVYDLIEPEFIADKEALKAVNHVSGGNFDFYGIQIDMQKAIQIMTT